MNRRARLSTLMLIAGLLLCFIMLGPAPLQPESQSKVIRDRNNKWLRVTLTSDHKYRRWISLSEISPELIEAVLMQEDRFFYRHPGFNPGSLLRAAWKSFQNLDNRQGGSTLTMQVARLIYQLNTKTMIGKIKQILLALELELRHSKSEILEAYLNRAPYGSNIEGVWAASWIYFSKSPKDLTLPEALTLAVIPKNPNRRGLQMEKGGIGNPVLPKLSQPETDGKTSSSLARARKILFEKWVRRYPESNDQMAALELPLSAQKLNDLPFHAPHFTDYILSNEFTSKTEIRTSLDLATQKSLERMIEKYLKDKSNLGIKNVSTLLIDHRSMEVRAWVGSASYFERSIHGQINGVRVKRSPGSTLKPFIYALGMDQGLIHPMSVLKDAPSSFGAFDPENFDGRFLGPIHAGDALNQSRNIPAVSIASQLNSPSLYGFLKANHITHLKNEEYYGLALPLGGAEMTLEELVRLYALLPNHGVKKRLVYLKTEEPPSKGEGTQVLSPESTELILEILKDNPRPGHHFNLNWTRSSLPVYWKTGTSQAFRDAWTLGIFGPYVLGIWIGNFNRETNLNFIGRELAAPLFFQIVDSIRAVEPDMKDLFHPRLSGIKRVKVCSLSGKLPNSFCKQLRGSGFIPLKSPIRICDIHREIWIHPKTGKRLCREDELQNGKSRVFEVWPTDLLRLFRLAGLPRESPPKYESNCLVESLARRGTPPVIQSPKKNLIYSLSLSTNRGRSTIPFRADSESENREYYWFVNDEWVGQTKAQAIFLWPARAGHFVVRVTDSDGLSAQRDLEVAIVE